MKKNIITFFIWCMLVALTEVPLTYICPSIRVIDLLIIDLYMILSILCFVVANIIIRLIYKTKQ